MRLINKAVLVLSLILPGLGYSSSSQISTFQCNALHRESVAYLGHEIERLIGTRLLEHNQSVLLAVSANNGIANAASISAWLKERADSGFGRNAVLAALTELKQQGLITSEALPNTSDRDGRSKKKLLLTDTGVASIRNLLETKKQILAKIDSDQNLSVFRKNEKQLISSLHLSLRSKILLAISANVGVIDATSISNWIKEGTGESNLASVRTTLNHLVKEGLISSQKSAPKSIPGGRWKNMYSLTPAGIESLGWDIAVSQWLQNSQEISPEHGALPE